MRHRFDDVFCHFLRITEQHHRPWLVEQRVVDAGITRTERALDDISASQDKFKKKGPLTSEDIFGADEIIEDAQVIATTVDALPPHFEDMANRNSEAFQKQIAKQQIKSL